MSADVLADDDGNMQQDAEAEVGNEVTGEGEVPYEADEIADIKISMDSGLANPDAVTDEMGVPSDLGECAPQSPVVDDGFGGRGDVFALLGGGGLNIRKKLIEEPVEEDAIFANMEDVVDGRDEGLDMDDEQFEFAEEAELANAETALLEEDEADVCNSAEKLGNQANGTAKRKVMKASVVPKAKGKSSKAPTQNEYEDDEGDEIQEDFEEVQGEEEEPPKVKGKARGKSGAVDCKKAKPAQRANQDSEEEEEEGQQKAPVKSKASGKGMVKGIKAAKAAGGMKAKTKASKSVGIEQDEDDEEVEDELAMEEEDDDDDDVDIGKAKAWKAKQGKGAAKSKGQAANGKRTAVTATAEDDSENESETEIGKASCKTRKAGKLAAGDRKSVV